MLLLVHLLVVAGIAAPDEALALALGLSGFILILLFAGGGGGFGGFGGLGISTRSGSGSFFFFGLPLPFPLGAVVAGVAGVAAGGFLLPLPFPVGATESGGGAALIAGVLSTMAFATAAILGFLVAVPFISSACCLLWAVSVMVVGVTFVGLGAAPCCVSNILLTSSLAFLMPRGFLEAAIFTPGML